MTRAPLSLSGLWVLEDKVRCTLKAIGNMEVWCAVVAVMGDKTSDLGALCLTASGCAAGIRISF
jgi:hypothetical protein